MNDISSYCMNRRTVLKMGAATILASTCTHPVLAAVSPYVQDHCELSFYNIHTGETLNTFYRSDGQIVRQAMTRISHIMRDHRTGDIKPVDPNLLDLLHNIASVVHPHTPFSIISGYRSPSTNAALRKVTSGVAKKSLHMEGRAIDIRIPGYRTATLRQVAISLQFGGVGYYPNSDFLHLDTGPIKIW